MRLSAVQVGYFEDYEDEEALEVAIAGIDESGVRRTFSFQRSSFGEPDEQDVGNGMDSYNVSTERGATVYGGLRTVRLVDLRLSLEFAPEDAQALGIVAPVEVDLGDADVNMLDFSAKLRNILEWGAEEKWPEIIGLDVAGAPSAE